MKAVGCILVVVWAFAGVADDSLGAEMPEASCKGLPRHSPPHHATDPHWHLRQHLQSEIRRLEESENIEPEERDRRILCLRGQLQHIDDVGRHHQEMLMRRHKHEKERLDRFGPRRGMATPPKRGVAQGDLKRRKQEFDRIRARNGQNMLMDLAARRERYGRDAESKSPWMDFGPVSLLIGIVALVVGVSLVSYVWMGVKAYTVYRKASVAYENKYGNFHSCAFCGQTRQSTHAIYHSVFRRTDVRLREYNIDRCGFAVYTCDKCLWRHRLRHFLGLTLIGTGYSVCLALAGRVVFWGLCLGLDWGISADSPLLIMISIFGSILGVFGGSLFALMACYPWLRRWFLAWRKLVERHSVVAELLEKGYEFDADWLRLVREGLDTEKRLRTLERSAFKYQTNVEHETYCWMGVLQDFNSGWGHEPKAAESLRYLQEREKSRGTPCTAKDLSLQRATKGILTIILVAIIYVIAKLLK